MKQAHYRMATDDYSIKADPRGSVYIKPQKRGLMITCHPNVEAGLTGLLGQSTGRNSGAGDWDYPEWVILK